MQPVRPKDLPRDLPGLTSLRALGALLVFGYHVAGGVPLKILAGGYCGVAFFFVLSGFVLTWGTDPRRGVVTFYVRRLARIYPSHIAVWLLVLLLPLTSGVKDAGHAIPNLFLVQAWSWRLDDVFSVNGVTWSLSCELFFYAMFPLLYVFSIRMRLRTQWLIATLYFVAAASVVVAGSFADPNSPLALVAGANPLVRMAEFVLGVVAARTIQAGWTVTTPFVGVVAVLCAAGFAVAHGSPVGSTWMAPIFAITIAAVASDTIKGNHKLERQWMVYAGKVSFAFYLVHQLVIKETFHLLGAGYLQAVAALVVACLLATLLHHGVELPAHRAIVTRLAARKVVTPSDAVAS